MAKIKTLIIPNAGDHVEKRDHSYIIDGNVNHSGKRTCQFLIQLSSYTLEHLL